MEDREQAHIKQKKIKIHPKETSNCLSHFFFCWEIPVVLKGWKQEFNEDDLYAPLVEYESKRLGDRLENLWQHEINFRKQPNLWRCLISQFGFKFMLYGIVYAPAEIAMMLLLPFFLRNLLNCYVSNQTDVTQYHPHVYAWGLAATASARVLFFHFFCFGTSVVGMNVRIACSSLIYRSVIKMKNNSIQKITLGQIINILSNDVNRFDQVAPNLHFLWIGVVELIIGTYYLDASLGHVSLGGIAIVLLCLVAQGFSMNIISKCRLKVAERTDYRIRLMNDIIYGIETIKMYTWERPFAKLVDLARRLELSEIKTSAHYRLFVNTFKIYMGKLCVFMSVLVTVLTRFPLTSQYVFALICIYESIKFAALFFMPLAAVMFAETIISVQRIEKFLLTDYYQKRNQINYAIALNEQIDICVLKLCQDDYRTASISLKNVFVKWDDSHTNYVLRNINFNASCGELIGVIGPAGCGKSTLLQVILKEIDIAKGDLKIDGSISYSSQEAWIFPTTIKQNILFGQDLDVERYLKVIKVCALERDLTLFPYGDQTLVGERGVMLSGGQKARINLARAVYRDADIYLLDDPLSAVDAHVARRICDECITGFLKNKCVVLVTHQTHYFQKANAIYQLELGKVVKIGNYHEIIACVNYSKQDLPAEPTTATLLQQNLRQEVLEDRGSRTTNLKIYKAYCLAAGHWSICFIVAVSYCFGQLSTSILDFFLTYWTNVEQRRANASTVETISTTENCLYIYIALTLLAVFANHLATFTFTVFSIRASQNLHTKMLSKVVSGSMTFFNHHPSGRILNRFSKDLGSVDELLPLHLMDGITIVLTGIAILVIVMVLNHWMIFPSILLLAWIISFTIIFQPSMRNIKRTEGITKSVVFTHMSTSIEGLTTIRAHNMHNKLIEEFDNKQDVHSSAYYLFTAIFNSFGFWADMVAVIYTTLTIFSFSLLKSNTYAGNIGLAITQSINLLGMIQYGVKTFGELDSQMTSVERIVEYAEIDPEPDDVTNRPPDTWPVTGKLEFRSVSLRYSPDDPLVLKQITFECQSGEKIGIVGRTGAGKSSLISVLFRFFDYEGSIIIDNIDTKSVRLQEIRSKISIIPQEPLLFMGTLRKNIDPFDEYSDSQLWNALEELELKLMVSNLPSGLESHVAQRGSNFSVGERQLLCLVRAMLGNNKIVVLDEATANIDLKTDELIQRIIRNKFKNCTVLMIAHRLHTIIDSDRILVMDSGKIVEFDHPYKLLQNSNGIFYGFVVQNGDKMLKDFIQISKNKVHQ